MNWYKYISIFALCSLFLLSGCSIEKRVKKADKKFAIGEYYDAAQIYKQCNKHINAKKQRELKAHVSFRQGECCRILNDGKAYMMTAPYMMIFPALMIMITCFAFNLMGDGLRDAFDPRLK